MAALGSLAHKIAAQRASKEVWAVEMALAHGRGTKAHAAYIAQADHWRKAAEAARAGDTSPMPWVAP